MCLWAYVQLLLKVYLCKMSKTFEINKGILKPLEFKGLRAQYIVIAIAGFAIAFAIYMVISFISSIIAIIIGVVIAILSIGTAFYLNNKFGTNGLSRIMAQRGCTKYINNNKRIYKLIKYDSKI